MPNLSTDGACSRHLPADQQVITADQLDGYLIIAEDGSVVPASTVRFVRTADLSEEDSECLDMGNDNMNWEVACRTGSPIMQVVLL